MATSDEHKRCERCSNYLSICGHDLPFAERAASVMLDKSWMPAASSNNPKL